MHLYRAIVKYFPTFLNLLIPIFVPKFQFPDSKICLGLIEIIGNIYTFREMNSSSFISFFNFQGFFRLVLWMAASIPVSRSFQRRHLHVAAVISFPTWKSSLLLVCFLPSCVILRGKVCLTNLGASYLTAATNYDTEKANFSTKFRRYEYRASKSFEITFVYIYLFFLFL